MPVCLDQTCHSLLLDLDRDEMSSGSYSFINHEQTGMESKSVQANLISKKNGVSFNFSKNIITKKFQMIFSPHDQQFNRCLTWPTNLPIWLFGVKAFMKLNYENTLNILAFWGTNFGILALWNRPHVQQNQPYTLLFY